jgi:hypothetical protein
MAFAHFDKSRYLILAERTDSNSCVFVNDFGEVRYYSATDGGDMMAFDTFLGWCRNNPKWVVYEDRIAAHKGQLHV